MLKVKYFKKYKKSEKYKYEQFDLKNSERFEVGLNFLAQSMSKLLKQKKSGGTQKKNKLEKQFQQKLRGLAGNLCVKTVEKVECSSECRNKICKE